MTRVVEQPAIMAALRELDVVAAMEAAFVAWSAGEAVVPPVGELLFDDPPGDVHIKFGYIRGRPHFAVKVACGFYANPSRGLPANDGVVLMFDQATGQLAAVLLDGGMLTDHRTAAAGAVAAKHLAPQEVDCIGIIGTGVQAELQLRYLAQVTDCRRALLWGRDRGRVESLMARLADAGFVLEPAPDVATLAQRSRLIVTTTASTGPLLERVQAGTHITAVGADTPQKQELAPGILAAADRVVTDSIDQAQSRGEIFQAVRAGELDYARVDELGEIIRGNAPGRTGPGEVTVADLTGVATQDIVIGAAVMQHAEQGSARASAGTRTGHY